MLNIHKKEWLYMARAFLSLGSNEGERLTNIQQAVLSLSMDEKITIIKTSSFYETEPWGNVDQPWYINAAIAIDTTYTPEELLNICNDIETQLGRVRNNNTKWTQRTLDIDILFYDNKIVNSTNLKIPHPLVQDRAFVLVPMLEVKSDLIHPIFKKTISEMYDELDNPEDVYLYGTLPERK